MDLPGIAAFRKSMFCEWNCCLLQTSSYTTLRMALISTSWTIKSSSILKIFEFKSSDYPGPWVLLPSRRLKVEDFSRRLLSTSLPTIFQVPQRIKGFYSDLLSIVWSQKHFCTFLSLPKSYGLILVSNPECHPDVLVLVGWGNKTGVHCSQR